MRMRRKVRDVCVDNVSEREEKGTVRQTFLDLGDCLVTKGVVGGGYGRKEAGRETVGKKQRRVNCFKN